MQEERQESRRRRIPITPILVWTIRALLADRNESHPAGHERTWRYWTSQAAHRRLAEGRALTANPGTVRRVAEALGVTLADLVSGTAARFAALEAVVRRADSLVMELTRSLTVSDAAKRRTLYDALFEHEMRKQGLSFTGLVEALKDQRFVSSLLATVPDRDLVIDIEPGMKGIVYTPCGGRPFRVEGPRLMWDCTCGPRPSLMHRKMCRIHGRHGSGRTATAFRGGLVEIRFEGLRFLWRNGPVLWPPSVDSFKLVGALQSAGYLARRHGSVLDLGSGTGFLGLCMAALGEQVAEVHLADWLLTPTLYGALNAKINEGRLRGAHVFTHLGMMTDWLGTRGDKRGFDLMVCNPPYLPACAGFDGIGVNCIVGGTDLLEFAVSQGPSIAHEVVVQCSDLAAKEAKGAAKRRRVRLTELKGSVLEVPLRVPDAWKTRGYLEALRRERNLRLRRGADHRYWHTLRAFVVGK